MSNVEARPAELDGWAIPDASPIGIVVVDRDLRYVYLNDVAAVRLGSSAIGRSILEGYDQGVDFASALRRALDTGLRQTLARCVAPSGRVYDVDIQPHSAGATVYYRDVGALAQRELQARAVAELGVRALREHDVRGVIHAATELVRRAIDADVVRVLVAEGEKLRVVAASGCDARWVGDTVSPKSLAALSLASDRPVVSSDVRRDARFDADRMMVAEDIASGVGVVVSEGGVARGVLAAYTRRHREFDDHDAMFVQSVANVIGSALERQRASDIERSRTAYLRQVLDSVGAYVAVLDREGRVREVNRAAAIGMTKPGDILGNRFVEGSWFDRNPAARDAIARVIDRARGGESATLDIDLQLESGEIRTLHTGVVPMRDAEGNVTDVVVTGVDVTDRVRAEQQIRRNEALLRSLNEQSREIVTLADENANVRFISPAIRDVMGYAPADMVGKSMIDFVHPDDLPTVADGISLLLQDGTSVEIDVRVRKANGEYCVLAVRGRNLLRDPAIAALVFTAHDVTERVHAEVTLRERERQLEHSQKMEAVGRLAGGIAHDFNNMLAAIRTYGDLLRDELRPEDPMRADVDEICRAADRAAALTRQLLAFSRQQIFQPRAVDLQQIVRGLEPMLRRLIGEDIELVVHASEVEVYADGGQIEQVILNLVVNARDAMPRGGRLEIDVAPDGDHAVVRVRDQGCGMPPEVQARIFEPFYTTKPQGKGTGLGLSTVYGVVTQSGGTIAVDSDEGRGTTFTVTLPLAPRGDRAAESESAPRKPTRGHERVLLVEDDAILRAVSRRSLTRAGYDVVEASDGEEACRIAREQERFDLVLTDLVMPRMGGLELLEQLRKAGIAAPVVLMTGYTEDERVRRGELPMGANLLEKPFTADSLARAVRSALDQRLDQRVDQR